MHPPAATTLPPELDDAVPVAPASQGGAAASAAPAVDQAGRTGPLHTPTPPVQPPDGARVDTPSAGLSSAPTSGPQGPADPQLQAQVRRAQVRMLFEQMWLTTWAAAGFAIVLAALLWSVVPPAKVGLWLAAKLAIIAPRLVHARLALRRDEAEDVRSYRVFIALLAVDALIWGLAGWWLLPLQQLDIAAVIAASLVGATALATFTLYSDWRAAVCFVLPVMLPMALHMTQRGDRYGAFGAGSVALFTVLLLIETRRSQRNLVELLSLRYTTDRIARERADALQLAQHHIAVKSRFLATMSHELRTPLHGILGLTRQVRERLQMQEQVRVPVSAPIPSPSPSPMPALNPAWATAPDAGDLRRLQLVERSGQHLLAVINDVLDFSRIEAGRLTLVEADFDLAALVDDVLALSTVAATDKGLSLRCRLRVPRPCPVRGDAARVRQVLHNLVGNAVKFTDRGSVSVTVWREGGRTPADASQRVLIAVQDTGPGIPPAELARIFDAFHQVDAVGVRRQPGTGLGLSIARELARAMGGDLVCTSTPGQGATFTFSVCLPAAATPPSPVPAGAAPAGAAPYGAASAGTAPPPPPSATPRSLQGLRVLLAEDNPVNALVAEAALQQLGCVVETVADGAAAVARLEAGAAALPAIDLVLMDCQMPVMDGFEAVRCIRAHEAAGARTPLPILALTASALSGDRERCLAAGMQGHLAKPFGTEELAAALRALLTA